MSDEPKCSECDRPVSYETGFTMTSGLGDNSQDRLYCPDCAPDTGKGYTLSDLQKLREENAVHRARYQQSLMDKLGPDVYFHVQGRERRPQWNR